MTERVHNYHDGTRYWQDKFDTRRLADRGASRCRDRVDALARKIIEAADMFFLATCDHRGLPTCSYKGGDPGFVKVIDDASLAFPNYDGNGKFLSMGNLRMNPCLGMLFIDFEEGRRLRVQGVAMIRDDDELLATYPGAQFIVRVQVNEVYNNCPRYIHRYQLVERSQYIPRAHQEPPIPEWKLRLESPDLLPVQDPARRIISDTR